MGIENLPPPDLSNVNKGNALSEGSRPAGTGVSSELRGSRSSPDRPVGLSGAGGQNLRSHRGYLALLESGVPLKHIPDVQEQLAKAVKSPDQANLLSEWLIHFSACALQQGGTHMLNLLEPLTPLVRQCRQYYAGQVSAQTLAHDWQSTWSKLSHPATPSEFLEGVNQAIEHGMSPLVVLYGLGSLCAIPQPMIPLRLLAAAMLGYGHELLTGWLRESIGTPALESTRILLEVNRLTGNCASLRHYSQQVFDSVNSWVAPSPGARLRIAWDKGTVSAEILARWHEDKRWLESDRASTGMLPQALVHVDNPQPGRSESSLTNDGRRLASPLQGVPSAFGGALSWLLQQSQPAVRETDVETPLYTAPSAVYQTTTERIAEAGRHLPVPVMAVAAAVGTVTGGFAVIKGAKAFIQYMTGDPDLIQPASEPIFAQHPPPVQALLDKLKNHWHLTPEGELMSTLQALKATRAAADANTLLARVSAQLHQDFGESLAPLLDLATPAADADFDEFDALEEIVPVRQRRAAGTGLQAAERFLAEDVVALLDQASSGAQQQDQWLQQEVLRELLSSLPPGHWLHNASAGEQALWLTTTQTLDEGYQRLANLKYDSLAQFQAQRPALQQALAEVNQGELQQAVLKSRLKGDLSPAGSYMDGLAVVMAALNNDPRVAVGSLRLAIGKGADAVSVPLAQWQVFVRRDARGKEDGVVLYRPAERRVQAFSSQQEMFQHPDLKRMHQSLRAEVRPPATPGPATSRPTAPTAPAPKGLPELALENALPAQRPALRRTFDERGRRADLWASGDFQLHTYPGASLQDKLGHRAGELLDSEQARLQRLAASPQLATQMAAAARTEQQYMAFVDENLPTLRAFTRRTETRKLTEVLQGKGGLAANATVDADAVLITFNGQTLNWTDWVLEGYRRHGDNVFAISNNFLADARFEHDDPAVVQALGTVKQDVQHYLRSTYAGNQYIEYLKQWLAPNDLRGQAFAQLRSTLIQQQLQVTLEQARVDGTIDPYTAGEFRTLVDGLRTVTVTDTGKASLQALQVNGLRIPEVLVLSLRQRAQEQRSAAAQRSDYVYLQGPYGPELLKLSDYQQLISTSGAYYDDLQARALLEDKINVEQAQRDQRNTRVSSVPIDDFCRDVDQWLWDGIKNANEASTSRKEMILDQFFKGVGGAAGVTCMAGSLGIATVPCAALTLGLIGHDAASALHHLEHGRLDDALMDVAFLALDVLDMGPGLGALKLHRLLDWAGKAHFSSATELGQAVQAMARQRDTAFTPLGQLNEALARSDVTREQLTALSPRPGKADAGTFYSHDGKHYIQDRYQDQVKVYEVYSDNGWATVRVRDPQRPHGQGAPVHYRDGHWRADEGGLPGGGTGSSSLGGEEQSSLLGKGAGSSGFSSEDQWEAYLRLFTLDPENQSNAEVIRALHSAIANNKPLPKSSFEFLKNKSDGWRAYGLFGQTPFDSLKNSGDPDTLRQMAEDFDFSNAPALAEWLWHDRLEYSGPRKTPWPLWGIKYARGETVLKYYSPEDVLSDMQAFADADVTRAYLREFYVLKKETRERLLTDRINGREVVLTVFPKDVLFEARVQKLIESGAFADDQAVREYLAAFWFPADGDILKMALLNARIKGGRTPAWAGVYTQFESWKAYRSVMARTPEARRLALQQVLVSEGICIDLERAYNYLFKQFSALDKEDTPVWELCEELVLAAVLERERRPVWAIGSVKPESLMNIYRSEDIPVDMSRLEIVFSPDSLEQRLLLPADMRRLSVLKIVSDSAVTTPLEVRLPINMPRLEELHVQSIRFQQPLSLDRMYELAKLHISNCNDEEVLHFTYLPKLRSAKITNNRQLRELKVGRGIRGLQTLDISSNPQLRELVLGASMDELQTLSVTSNPHLQTTKLTFPAAMPDLHKLNLQGNNLPDVSFLRNVRLPELWKLDLSRNQLRGLTSMPRLPVLEELQLEVNAFREIPRFVTDLATPVKVNMIDNFISDRALHGFEADIAWRYPDQAVVQFTDLADEPSTRYGRPLGEMVAICSVAREGEALRSLWGGLDGEAYATEFSTFLARLYQSSSFEDVVFRQEVSAWLERLAADTELRRETFRAADSACASCDDRVASVYNKMQEIDLRLNV